jgi:hypothetical protein
VTTSKLPLGRDGARACKLPHRREIPRPCCRRTLEPLVSSQGHSPVIPPSPPWRRRRYVRLNTHSPGLPAEFRRSLTNCCGCEGTSRRRQWWAGW